MALSGVWRLCLVMVILGVLGWGSQDPLLHHHLRTLTLDILYKMAPRFPVSCRSHRGKLPSLDVTRLYGGMEPGDRKLIVHQALRRIRGVYRRTPNATWDGVQTDLFRDLLDRQLDGLREFQRKRLSPSGRSRKNGIRNYFRKLRGFLLEEGYSTCSWAVVLDETRRILQQVYTGGTD